MFGFQKLDVYRCLPFDFDSSDAMDEVAGRAGLPQLSGQTCVPDSPVDGGRLTSGVLHV
jgi:hypothetical protein